MELSSSANEVSVKSLDLKTKNYWFRIKTYDPCLSTSNLFSDQKCFSYLKAEAKNGFNSMSWNAINLPSGYKYILLAKGIEIFSTSSDTVFNDNQVTCNEEYCYKLLAKNGADTLFIANQVCVNAFSLTPPPKITSANASVDNEAIQLSWTLQKPAQKMILIKEFGSAKEEIELTDFTSFSDSKVSVNSTVYTYRLVQQGLCGNWSDTSNIAQNVLLTKNVNDSDFQFNWTAYKGKTENFSYELISVNSGELVESFAKTKNSYTEASATLSDKGNEFYLQVLDANGNVISTSNRVILDDTPNIILPTAFSPNQDGINDFLIFKAVLVKKYRVEILNRWGVKVFETEDPNLFWDGFLPNGEPALQGMYTILINGTSISGASYKKMGTFVLVR